MPTRATDTKAATPVKGVCLCGCGGATVRGEFCPGHDRRAEALLTEMEFGTVAERVRAWMESHPGHTIDAEYLRRHPPAIPRVATARAQIRRYISPSTRHVSDELITERRAEAARQQSPDIDT